MMREQPQPDGAASFSVIVPLGFHRDQAEACLRAWLRAQTYARNRYEVIVVAPDNLPSRFVAPLRALLGPHDRWIASRERHDMALSVEGTRVATGNTLFFTESHCRPEPDVLTICAEALRTHPQWAGFSCQSVRVTHNRLSVIEADMYEADILEGMTTHPWRKILDQCFVVRRDPYFATGGFDPALGHYAEWALAAMFFQHGLTIGFVPEARIHHYYCGELREWRTFTRDFVQGEMRFFEQSGGRGRLQALVAPEAWRSRENWDPASARMLVRLLRAELARTPADAVSADSRDGLRDALRRWTPAALSGPHLARTGAILRSLLARARLVLSIRTASTADLKAELMAGMEVLADAERLTYLAARARRMPGARPTAAAVGAWEPNGDHGWRLAGFHDHERWNGQPVSWSEPIALMRLPLPPGMYDTVVQWLPIRPADRPPAPSFYVDEQAIPADQVHPHHARFVLTVPDGADARLAWLCRDYAAPDDARRLGLPIRRVAWRRIGDAGADPPPARHRPLLLLHVRKTAGAAFQRGIVNRFAVGRLLLQAHAPRHAHVDPSPFDFVAGHVDVRYLSRFAERPLVMTLLREPLDRALSAYHFFRGHTPAFFTLLAEDLDTDALDERRRFHDLANRTSLLDFLTRDQPLAQRHLSNVFTRTFLAHPPHGPLDGTHLAEAKERLASCDIIGLRERLDDTLALLAHHLEWDGLDRAPRYNETRGRPAFADEDPRALDMLADWNQLDTELYTFATGLFGQRVGAIRVASAATDDGAAPRRARLPDATAFTVVQPIHGSGWYPRELHDGKWICWMGPHREAWIDLGLSDPVPSFLSCRIPHAVSPSVLASVQLLVNGTAVDLRCRSEGATVVLQSGVPAHLLYGFPDRVRITFRVSGTMPAPVQSGAPPDDRSLGIAVSAISLVPA